jgi:rare lipoprotein A
MRKHNFRIVQAGNKMSVNFKNCVALIVVAISVAGCSFGSSPVKSARLDPFAGKGSPYYEGSGEIPMGGGRRHLGKPYQVAGRWFSPREQPSYDKSGVASWYGEAFHRRQTSNGEFFDMNQLTAAHATLPLPSYAKVTNLETGASIIVRLNDRGPFVDTRIIDLSKRSADALGFQHKGKAEVRVRYIGPAPIDDKNGSHLMAMNQALEQGNSFATLKRQSSETAVAAAETPQAEPQMASYQAEEPEPQPRDSRHYVEIGTFQNPDNAAAAEQQFAQLGNVRVIPTTDGTAELFQVKLGPFKTTDEANYALAQAKIAGFVDARVISRRPMQMAMR